MKIHYRKGSENARADAMSRREDYMKGEPKKGIQLLVRNADGTLQVNKIAATSMIRMNTFKDKIKEALLHNQLAAIVRDNLEEHASFEDKRGILYFDELVYVLKQLQQEFLEMYHDGPIQGHPGIAKML
jgi:hypothetical protein